MGLNTEHIPMLSHTNVVPIVLFEVIFTALLPIVADYSLRYALLDDSIAYSLERHVSKVLVEVKEPHSRFLFAVIEGRNLLDVELESLIVTDFLELRLEVLK
jgi:hypothetical protein